MAVHYRHVLSDRGAVHRGPPRDPATSASISGEVHAVEGCLPQRQSVHDGRGLVTEHRVVRRELSSRSGSDGVPPRSGPCTSTRRGTRRARCVATRRVCTGVGSRRRCSRGSTPPGVAASPPGHVPWERFSPGPPEESGPKDPAVDELKLVDNSRTPSRLAHCLPGPKRCASTEKECRRSAGRDTKRPGGRGSTPAAGPCEADQNAASSSSMMSLSMLATMLRVAVSSGRTFFAKKDAMATLPS